MIRGPFGQVLIAKPLSLPPPKTLQRSKKATVEQQDTFPDCVNEFYNYQDFYVSNSQLDLESAVSGLSSKSSIQRLECSGRLLYYCQGHHMNETDTREWRHKVHTNSKHLLDLGILQHLYPSLIVCFDTFKYMSKMSLEPQIQMAWDAIRLETTRLLSILYMLFLTQDPRMRSFVSDSEPFLPLYLFQVFNDVATGSRQHFPVKKLVLLLEHVVALCVCCKDKQEVSLKAELNTYEQYFAIMSHRYPAYCLPEPSQHLQVSPRILQGVSKQVQEYLIKSHNGPGPMEWKPFATVHPFVQDRLLPIAFEESVDIFKKHSYIPEHVHQLAQERHLLKQTTVYCQPKPDIQIRTLNDRFVMSLMPHLSNFGSMLMKLLYYLNLAAQTESQVNSPLAEKLEFNMYRQIVTRSISHILVMLLKATKAHHLMTREYLGQALLDGNCIILVLKMLVTWYNKDTLDLTTDPKELLFYSYCTRNHVAPWEPQPQTRITETTTHLLAMLQKITKNKPQRIFTLIQWRSSMILKRIVKLHTGNALLYALKLLKSQIPYLGRKWKTAANLKIISLIYHHLQPRLVETYLSGELEMDTQEANRQEHDTRTLVQAYLERNYPQLCEPTPAMDLHYALSVAQKGIQERDPIHKSLFKREFWGDVDQLKDYYTQWLRVLEENLV
ncbi:hypothetical protein EDD86DRAFT_209376 [Gorgonomyces haynaldii]|nr:hypothetical protein EDD86DRAFT_209376 [Gorgonomyces haynaldii]